MTQRLFPSLLLATTALAAFQPSAAPASESDSIQLQSFDKAWELINERYWDPDFGGLDWAGVRDELRPDAAKTHSNAELREVLNEMISRLGQSHFGVIPGEATGEAKGAEPEASCFAELEPAVRDFLRQQDAVRYSAGPGFDLRFVEGQALVVTVDAGGPAAEAGMATGWQVRSVAGQNIEQLIGCLGDGREGRGLEALAFRVLSGLLQGAAGSQVDLQTIDLEDQSRDITLRRAVPKDIQSVKFGNLPEVDFRFAQRREALPQWLDSGDAREALVLGFNIWMMPVAEAFENALVEGTAVEGTGGVVIDLRGNPGGVAILAAGLGGYFVDQAQSLGTLQYRKDTLRLMINPRTVTRSGQRIDIYDGPLAILVDQFSASTSEVFAGGMHDLERAFIVGETSMGAALPSVIQELPNGDFLQHAMADLLRPNGTRLEGIGVEPDLEVPRTREGVRAGRDEPLEAALQWIAEQIAEGDGNNG